MYNPLVFWQSSKLFRKIIINIIVEILKSRV